MKIITCPTNVTNLVNNFIFWLSNVLMQIYSPHRGKTYIGAMEAHPGPISREVSPRGFRGSSGT
jgi:hypothetical protein